MNVINKITLENIKKNKKRTAVTIIGVMLSAALICVVAGMVMSFKQSLINMAKTYTGDYHITYQNVPQEELKYIENNVNIESYFYSKDLGYAKLEKIENEYKPYVDVLAFTDKAMENNGLKLKEGRLPENENEIVIPANIKSDGMLEWKIGDTITLNIGERKTLDGYELNQENTYNSYNEDEEALEQDANIIDEEIVNTTSKTYKIVGIIARMNYTIEPYSAPGYTMVTYLKNSELGKQDEKYGISVRFKEPKEYKTANEQILETLKKDTGKEIKTYKNKQLLEYEGALSENTLKTFYYLGGIIIIIILFSSVFVIRNSFKISVTEKTKQYGMLASIGATAKQIRKSVLFEGVIIGIIGIILGVLLGIAVIFILIKILNLLLLEMLEFEFVYSIPLVVIFITIGVSALTIFLSSIIPAIKAGKISQIEAIRGNNDIKIKAKKVKTSKLTKKIFGIGGVIASKNLKRSKKKYRATVISLVVSISVFIALSSFLDYGKQISSTYYADMDYDISIYGGNTEIYKEIVNQEGITDYSYYKTRFAKVDMKKYGTDFAKRIASGTDIAYIGGAISINLTSENGIEEITTSIAVIDREAFDEFARSLGIRTNDYSKVAILEDDMLEQIDKKGRVERHIFNIKEGQDIELKILEKDTEEVKEETKINITKISNKRPRGYESVYNGGGTIFISEEYYDKQITENLPDGSLYLKCEDPDKTEKDITSKYDNLMVSNIYTYAKQMDRMILVVSIFLYGFIIVITLIGVTNIFNTITTNMILRSKEFAMLKSVGMTSKEFNKMIRLESIMYGLKSLLFGIPLGLIGSYAIFKAFANEIDYGYRLPISAIIISIVCVFIIVGLTMKYSLNKINKQNIVETIRNDNI